MPLIKPSRRKGRAIVLHTQKSKSNFRRPLQYKPKLTMRRGGRTLRKITRLHRTRRR